MKNITINTTKSNAVHEWMAKEYGSWEDHNYAPDHAYAILKRFGGKVTLTEDECNTIIQSGSYQGTGWNDDEIEGGAVTKKCINRYVSLIKNQLYWLSKN